MYLISDHDNPRSTHESYHWSDCVRITNALLAYGIMASPNESYDLWDEHSSNMDAGWLFLPDTDEEIYNEIYYMLERKGLFR